MRPLLGGAAVCTVLCVVVLVVSGSPFVIATGITLGGTAVVLLVSASFLAVGQAEDRQRALDRAERAEDRPH
jgi:UDP-N-acetylmuramyl pentapeptide phosphotransferase/UDP-N-acetylglucosamine-1-phosphate transferase